MYGILDTSLGTKDGHDKSKPENLELAEVTDNSQDKNRKFESMSIWLT